VKLILKLRADAAVAPIAAVHLRKLDLLKEQMRALCICSFLIFILQRFAVRGDKIHSLVADIACISFKYLE
jgi:hypothetical protein